jgi:hypothetical protein
MNRIEQRRASRMSNVEYSLLDLGSVLCKYRNSLSRSLNSIRRTRLADWWSAGIGRRLPTTSASCHACFAGTKQKPDQEWRVLFRAMRDRVLDIVFENPEVFFIQLGHGRAEWRTDVNGNQNESASTRNVAVGSCARCWPDRG